MEAGWVELGCIMQQRVFELGQAKPGKNAASMARVMMGICHIKLYQRNHHHMQYLWLRTSLVDELRRQPSWAVILTARARNGGGNDQAEHGYNIPQHVYGLVLRVC